MYTPPHFKEEDSETLFAMIRANPLGTLVVARGSEMEVNHVPFVLDTVGGQAVRLRAHIPKANPLTSIIRSSQPCVAIFQGPNLYISPSWYATKSATGKVVPTWNYAVVHVHGRIQIREESAWVSQQVKDLTESQECNRENPWAVDDAPADFTQRLVDMLTGLEVTIERVDGKTKASQNQPRENRESVLEAIDNEVQDLDAQQMMRAAIEPAS